MLDCDWGRKFLKNGGGFPFLRSPLVLLLKQCVPTAPISIIVGFGPKMSIQIVAASFAFPTVVKTKRSLVEM